MTNLVDISGAASSFQDSAVVVLGVLATVALGFIGIRLLKRLKP